MRSREVEVWLSETRHLPSIFAAPIADTMQTLFDVAVQHGEQQELFLVAVLSQ